MGIKKYMNRLIDKARGGVQKTVENIGPIKKMADVLDTGGGRPPVTPERSKPVPPKKRKKIKPKGTSFTD